MKKYICDMRGCGEEAVKLDISTCTGYMIDSQDSYKTIIYKPFEKPTIVKVDLCRKHFTEWCKLTYSMY